MAKQKYERPIIKNIQTGMPAKAGIKTLGDPVTHIDGVPVKTLLEEHGSPLYVVSEKTIREEFERANQAFSTRYPKVQFAWSYKTNYLDAVCKVYHDLGSWAEVVSGFEYDKAIANGVQGKHIIFNGPDKSNEDLKKALENGSLIHIDHFDELYALIDISRESAKKAKVAIRINMDTGIYPRWDRFGFNYDNNEAWTAINRIMHAENLELTGLHCHIGTYIMTANAYSVAATKMSELAVRVAKKFDHTIKYIDMGGGFASPNTLRGALLSGADTCPSFDDYAEAITTALLNSELDPNNMPTLILETGRALIDKAGNLLGTVLANKRLADGKRSMVIDIGVNLLFTSFWYDHNIVPAQEYSGFTESTTIYGPLCMNIDVIRPHIEFPPLQRGENVAIRRIGAYNMTQWLQFITLRPRIVMISPDGKVHLIREREQNESLTQHEHIPEHLKNVEI